MGFTRSHAPNHLASARQRQPLNIRAHAMARALIVSGRSLSWPVDLVSSSSCSLSLSLYSELGPTLGRGSRAAHRAVVLSCVVVVVDVVALFCFGCWRRKQQPQSQSQQRQPKSRGPAKVGAKARGRQLQNYRLCCTCCCIHLHHSYLCCLCDLCVCCASKHNPTYVPAERIIRDHLILIMTRFQLKRASESDSHESTLSEILSRQFREISDD